MIGIQHAADDSGFTIKIRGHAGTVRAGADPVCAAVSMLAYTLASVVAACCKDAQSRLEPGDAEIVCRFSEGDDATRARHAYEMALTGFALLQRHTPHAVEIFAGDESFAG